MPLEETTGCLAGLIEVLVELVLPLVLAPFQSKAPIWKRLLGLVIWGGFAAIAWWVYAS